MFICSVARFRTVKISDTIELDNKPVYTSLLYTCHVIYIVLKQ